MTGILAPHEMLYVLKANIVGRIGFTDGAKIFVVPVHYVLEKGNILCNAQPGMKIQMMRKNPEVCFEVDTMKTFTQWQSVIVHGCYEEITGREEKQAAAETFVTYMMHQEAYKVIAKPTSVATPVHPRPLKRRTIFYRILITEMTGRFEDSERDGHVHDVNT